MKQKFQHAEELIADAISVLATNPLELPSDCFQGYAQTLNVIEARTLKEHYSRIARERARLFSAGEVVPYQNVYSLILDALTERVDCLNREERYEKMRNEFQSV